jgi:hypothetical protein
MRTTIDIPDERYKQLKRLAIERDSTVRELVLQAIDLLENQPVVAKPRQRLKLPLIRSDQPGTLHLTNEQIYDILDADLIDSAGH